MSISIVTVTYNSSQKINLLLRSIAKQTGIMDIELIIVDNNSPDQKELKQYIQKFREMHPDIRIITAYKKNNLGFGVSCNFGASLSNFENILFLNPDTILTKKCLSILINHARNSNADICGGMSIHIDSRDVHRTVFKKPTFQTMLFEFSNLGKITGLSGNFYYDEGSMRKDSDVDGVGGAYLLVKRESFKQLNGFDKNIFMYLEDVDICIRAKKLGMRIVYCPHSIIKHVGGASSNNKYRIVQKAWYNSREYYAKKHFPLLQSGILVLLFKIERFLLEIRKKIIQP
jgi:hypothetical protein